MDRISPIFFLLIWFTSVARCIISIFVWRSIPVGGFFRELAFQTDYHKITEMLLNTLNPNTRRRLVGYSLRGEVWAHKTSLIPQIFIGVAVYSVSVAESERLCTRVLGTSMSPCFYDFSIIFRNCPDIMLSFSFFLLLVICTTDSTCTICL